MESLAKIPTPQLTNPTNSTVRVPRNFRVLQQYGTITAVSDGTPAEDAGLRAGDLIVDFADEPVSSIDDLHRLLTEERIGEIAAIRVLRRGELRRLLVIPREVA